MITPKLSSSKKVGGQSVIYQTKRIFLEDSFADVANDVGDDEMLTLVCGNVGE